MNILNDIRFSYEDFISNLKKIGKQQLKTEKDIMIENFKFNFPLSSIFWNFVWFTGYIPSANEFVEIVFRRNMALTETKHLDAMVARLHRAYCSFIRDMQVCLYLREQKGFRNVGYEVDYDLENGIDCYFTYNNVRYAVAIYCDTKRSNFYKKKKDNKQTKLGEFTYVDLKFNMKNYRNIGNIWIFRQKHMDDFIKKIKEGTHD